MAEHEGTPAKRRSASLPRVGLALILALYLALAALQSFATRLQWGPDEPAHIVYLRSLAMDGRLPALAHSDADNIYLPGASRSHQAQHPPLYYLLAAPLWRAFAARPDETVSYVDRASGGIQRFSVPGPVRPVRLLSVLLGALTLIFVWAVARTVFPERPALWLAAAALTAFTPMFTYVNSVINNDALLGLTFAAAAWLWARLLRFGAGWRDVLLLGLLLGLALNVKQTAFALAFVSVLVLILAPGKPSWKQRASWIAAILALTVALGAWWFLRNWLAYNKLVVHPFFEPLLQLPEPQRSAVLSAMPARVFLFTLVPVDAMLPYANIAALLRLFASLAFLALIGLVTAFARRRRTAMARHEALSLALWMLAGAVVLAGLLWNALRVDWRMGTSGGRLLVCVLPLAMMASARGLSALFGERRASHIALASVSLLLLALNLYAIWAIAAGYQTLGFTPP
ncbi:MAG: glycosyltransferase family 39 protein [Armatimonadota bacterium]|nr:MAG: glycosyltransferase family 39 protein [Armatimonadota bacterium]